MGVRVPRLTIAADYDDESAFGDLSLLSLGYGLHQAWIYATMFGAESVFGIIPRVSGMYGTHISLAFLVSIVVFGTCLLIAAATDQKLIGIYVSKKTLAVGAALMCAGSLLLLVPPPDQQLFPIVLESVSGIMTGIGSATLILFWGVAFARCDAASIVLNTAVAIVIGFGLYAFVLRELPFPIAGFLTGLIPLGECFILLGKTPQPYFERGEIPIFKPLPVRKTKFVLRFGIPVFVFGLALGTLRQTSIQAILPATSLANQALLLLAAGCSTVLILVTIIALNGAKRWNRLFRPLIPFVAVAAFFLPMAATDNLLISSFVLLIGYMCFEALMWIFSGELAQRFRLSPVFVFGLGRGFLALAALVGSLVPVVATQWAENLPFGESTVILFLLIVMVVAYALLPDEREIEAIVIPCPLVRTVSTHLEQDELEATIVRNRTAQNPKGAALKQARAARSTRSKSETRTTANGANANQRTSGSAAESGAEPETPQGGNVGDSAFPKETTRPVERQAEGEETSAEQQGAAAVGTEESGTSREPEGAAFPHEGGTASSGSREKGRQHENVASPQSEKETSSPQADGDAQRGRAASEQPMSEARAAMYAKSRKDDASSGEKRVGRFRLKCEMVANTFLLSRRETEVMFLLAKGHNSAYIQEKLYISEGTAKTHIRHIYRKLDVHTQQELMRLVESIETPSNGEGW